MLGSTQHELRWRYLEGGKQRFVLLKLQAYLGTLRLKVVDIVVGHPDGTYKAEQPRTRWVQSTVNHQLAVLKLMQDTSTKVWIGGT